MSDVDIRGASAICVVESCEALAHAGVLQIKNPFSTVKMSLCRTQVKRPFAVSVQNLHLVCSVDAAPSE